MFSIIQLQHCSHILFKAVCKGGDPILKATKSSSKEHEVCRVKIRQNFFGSRPRFFLKMADACIGKTLFPAYMNASTDDSSVMHLVEIKQSLVSRM